MINHHLHFAFSGEVAKIVLVRVCQLYGAEGSQIS